jgi:putative membrane protein
VNRILPSSVLWLALFAPAAFAQVSPQDRAWLVFAHQTDLAEVAAGDLAAHGGHTESVRNAGRMLVQEHRALDAKLQPLAQQLGVNLPDRPNAQQKAEMQRFRRESGMEFDRTWAHIEGDGHVLAIELTVKETLQGSSLQVKQLAAAALPVLKKHLEVLRQASARLTGNG